jgi:hypothetical protein
MTRFPFCNIDFKKENFNFSNKLLADVFVIKEGLINTLIVG